VTTVAFHVDQLFSPAPGGVGTYVRNLLPALVRQDPSVTVVPFHALFETRPSAADQALLGRFQDVELRAGDRLDLEPGTGHAATVGPDGCECLEASR
jgi:hypothetical protein